MRTNSNTRKGKKFFAPTTATKPILRIMLILGIAVQTMFTACGGDKGSFIDSRDGKAYKSVKIGEQIWMAENLNYEIKGYTGNICYDNELANCEKYGLLYDYKTAIKACPEGWHLPSSEEWYDLANFAGGYETAGKYLKSKDGWNNNQEHSGNGEDNYGFSALPGGGYIPKTADVPHYGSFLYSSSGEFYGIGSYGCWWSSTQHLIYGNHAYPECIGGDSDKSKTGHSNKMTEMYSVRCVKDYECGGKKYDHATHFCSSGKVATKEKCGDNHYNPEKYFCYYWGNMYSLYSCGGKPLNPETQYCSGEIKAKEKCGERYYYNPETQLCSGGNVLEKCGGKEYNPEKQFCDSKNEVKDMEKCVSDFYNPETHFCFKNEVIGKCGGYEEYNPETHFCGVEGEGENVVEKCGGEEYDLNEQFCYKGKVYDYCNDGHYNPETDYCTEFGIRSLLCGGKKFNVTTQFCFIKENKVYDKCEGKEYAPDFASCSGGKLAFAYGTVEIGRKAYRTAKLGTQIWMAEDLESKCEWEEAMAACPKGWHLPGSEEWQDLAAFAGNNAALKLMSDYYYGFSAKSARSLGAACFTESTFENCWWSSTEMDSSLADIMLLTAGSNITGDNKYAMISFSARNKEMSINVRCVKDGYECGGKEYEHKTQLCDTRDNKLYEYVAIGGQVWMARNLDYAGNGGKCYDDDPANCGKYGRLYDWETAKKACPSGWHLPMREEWTALTDFVGKSEGKSKLKAASGWNDGTDGTDEFGFAVLPGGYRHYDGTFDNYGSSADFWSATESNASNAWSGSFYTNNANMVGGSQNKTSSFSVRCVKNADGD